MNNTVITFNPVSHCEICGCAREKMPIEDWQILNDYFTTHNIEPYEAVRGLRVNTKTASGTTATPESASRSVTSTAAASPSSATHAEQATNTKEHTIPTLSELLGAELKAAAPPGTIAYSYLAVRVTAPTGRRLYITRAHGKSGTWRIQPTTRLGAIDPHGIQRDRETTRKIALHFAKTGAMP